MIFTFKKWDEFCRQLNEFGKHSIPACNVEQSVNDYLVLKHDVETNVSKALKMAKIENKYGHKGSYYVQAYLINNRNNVEMLSEIQNMGHEVSYHYDVMDSNKGKIDKAILEFSRNVKLFTDNGFKIVTVCQHGNPMIERIGYHSNRDFFRNSKVQEMYPELSDIMVDFKTKAHTEYTYYSDAGRKLKMIFDPVNNDIIDSDAKNVSYDNFNQLIQNLCEDGNNIVSTHPHRWTNSTLQYILKTVMFDVIKKVARLLEKNSFLRKVMSRYYYLAKKI